MKTIDRVISLGKNRDIEYKFGNNLDLDQVIELYKISTLGERRPIDDREVMKLMLQNADIVFTA